MKDISIYFQPLPSLNGKGEITENLLVHDENGFPEIEENGIAIIYVPEYRRSANNISGTNTRFREELAEFHLGDNWNFKLYDLGMIQPGNSVDDTYFALAQVISELVKKEVIPFIIGGSQDLLMACYKGFEGLERMMNICAIDNALDVGEPNEEISSNAFVSHLLMQRPCYLFNYATIGVQRLLVRQKEMDLFDKLFFDVCRLGSFSDNPRIAEPHLRNSDLLSIDFKSVRSSDSDPSAYDNVNGFRADQLCQIMKYAGLSDKMSCVFLSEVNPKQSQAASNLLAQLIWYFADGVANRVGDFPIGSKVTYKKFHITLEDFDEDLVFYKSDKSERWWLEVKYPAGQESKYNRHHLVPCDQDDYNAALKNEIPDLWWKTLQKLS
ncbi:arginase family protein [Crocinitomicaceae bacterium]|nr:arginase family protein [Crocinitomicaceae bacterium]